MNDSKQPERAKRASNWSAYPLRKIKKQNPTLNVEVPTRQTHDEDEEGVLRADEKLGPRIKLNHFLIVR
jgi:hypothetical protein